LNTKYSNSNIRNRCSIRLKGYDYRLPGAYFITLVSWQRECSFSEVVDGRIQLNAIGKIIQKEWRQLERHFSQIQLDAFVVMPNHVHGIIVIDTVGEGYPSFVRATHPSADEIRDTNDILVDQMKDNLDGSPRQGARLQTRHPNGPQTNSLGAMIGQFKSLATKRIWALAEINRHPIWQRNYYEHIMRDNLEYRRIIQYIETNPLQWHDDQLHPSVPGILEGINHGR
jgi:putative transposase